MSLGTISDLSAFDWRGGVMGGVRVAASLVGVVRESTTEDMAVEEEGGGRGSPSAIAKDL